MQHVVSSLRRIEGDFASRRVTAGQVSISIESSIVNTFSPAAPAATFVSMNKLDNKDVNISKGDNKEVNISKGDNSGIDTSERDNNKVDISKSDNSDVDFDPAAIGDRLADVYDGWYSSPVQGAAEIAATVDFLHARAGAGPALELGVGTGRIAVPLAARGVPVVGIDISPRMLDRMATKPGGRDVRAVVGDFAEVAASGGPFGLVYVVFNTFFGLRSQDAQVRCFVNVAAALRPGGLFVMEAGVPAPTRTDRDHHVQVDDVAGDTIRLSLSLREPISQQLRISHIVIEPHQTTNYPVELRYAWPSELDLMSRIAGLRLAERYSGWAGEPFTSSSPNHISVWRKPES
ncbi:methyltransferase domain-containing protein [Nocardia sp. R6R-6]|uniref:methyltransferase domain-containing protein n=1 Tax=Nocardia sp. R6R-6 TaxID=3459303 RepID=UPI00403DD5DE